MLHHLILQSACHLQCYHGVYWEAFWLGSFTKVVLDILQVENLSVDTVHPTPCLTSVSFLSLSIERCWLSIEQHR